MNKPERLEESDSTNIADRLARASAGILELRIALTAQAPPISAVELQELQQYESHLDHMVAFFRANGIYLLAEHAQDAVRNVNEAIDRGTQVVADIKQTKAAIKAAAGLLDLAGALLSRNPLAVSDAIKSLRAKPDTAGALNATALNAIAEPPASGS
ncbi:hypothetical protein [Janthinobacterium aquaticum]|uniref:hypothetical protein n=1 Tax=Janthinobacterium sp. FT58W TaxID=2654254 RepID=UPI001264951A|nr:hypothetical protein [Janthinobacterium sp. FT58W]KAB8044950.1 hypothetical protein GCM43_00440 [Janthinobacterium sp. FT58W]